MPKKSSDIAHLKAQFLKDREKPVKGEISEDSYYRMNGPIGREISKQEWNAMKIAAKKHK